MSWHVHFLPPLGIAPIERAPMEPIHSGPYPFGVLVEQDGERQIYVRLCVKHTWKGTGVDLLNDLETCPFCLAEREGRIGTERYAVWMATSRG